MQPEGHERTSDGPETPAPFRRNGAGPGTPDTDWVEESSTLGSAVDMDDQTVAEEGRH